MWVLCFGEDSKVPGLSTYTTACGILVSQPGIEPPSPTLEGGFLITRPPGKSLLFGLDSAL